ncbi:MAG: ArsC/Spx/MgsR family protein, partial [Armatimonadota bacterium]
GTRRMILWHNPACSKSRAVHEALAEAGITFEVRNYMEHPPTPAEVLDLARRVGVPPIDLVRTDEDEWKSAGLDPCGVLEDQVARTVSAYPKLLQRPILADGESAVISRPPSTALEWLRSRGRISGPIVSAGASAP